MANRREFTKTAIAALPLPLTGQRSTYYDKRVPKLALRITAANTRTFYVVKRADAGMAWVRLGTFPDMTVEQARKEAEKTLGAFAHGKNPATERRAERMAIALGEGFERYMALHVEPHGVKTAADLRAMWERCLGKLPDLPAKKHGRKRTKHPAGVDWQNRKLKSIETADVRALHANMGRAHPTMANRVVELLSSIYNRCREWGYTGPNPAHGIRPFKEQKRDRFVRQNELPALIQALADDSSEDFKHYVLLSLLTGARQDNVLAARWQDVRLESKTWRIPATKNGEPQTVPLCPEAVLVFESREPQSSGYVFPADSATGYMTPPKKRWAALLKRANVGDLRLHDLRRTLGSWQAITGASLAIIGKSLGHKSAEATLIYARLDLDPVRQSMERATNAMLEAAGLKQGSEVIPLRKRG